MVRRRPGSGARRPEAADVTMERSATADIAKTIGIILVVIGHYNPADAPEWYHLANRFIYAFHMPLFMFASGYIPGTAKTRGGGNFILKKFKRLMIPYFSTSVVIISIKLLTQQGMSVENPVTAASYIKMFYLPEAGYFLWFIWALWLIFLLISMIKTKTGRTVLFAASLLTGFLPVDWPEIFCINKAVAMLKYFMLGVFLINWPRWLDSAKKIPGMIPVCALPVLFACTLLVRNDILTGLMGYILPFAGIHTICVISARIKSLKHITQKLLVVSASSYIIYLFHTTFEGFVKSLVQQVPLLANGNDPLYFSVGAAAVIGAGIFLPIILHRYILQRNRLLRFLFGLKPAK